MADINSGWNRCSCLLKIIDISVIYEVDTNAKLSSSRSQWLENHPKQTWDVKVVAREWRDALTGLDLSELLLFTRIRSPSRVHNLNLFTFFCLWITGLGLEDLFIVLSSQVEIRAENCDTCKKRRRAEEGWVAVEITCRRCCSQWVA